METLRQDFIMQREEVSSELDRIRYQLDSIEIIIKNTTPLLNTTESRIYVFDNIQTEKQVFEPPRKKRRLV
jgi:hypothetical protein